MFKLERVLIPAETTLEVKYEDGYRGIVLRAGRIDVITEENGSLQLFPNSPVVITASEDAVVTLMKYSK